MIASSTTSDRVGLPDACFMEAFEQFPDSILVTDTAGTIVFVNLSLVETSGFSREELVGQTPRIFKSGQHNLKFYAQLWHTLEMGNVWRGEIKNRTKTGSIKCEDITIYPLLDESGTVQFYVSVARPAINAAEFESQIRQSQKMEAIGQLAAGIAHEINTPTQYIGDNIQFFQESIGGLFELVHKYAELTDAAQEHEELAALVESVRALSETINILQRIRELAVQSANGTISNTNRGDLQLEVTELLSQINSIANNTEFNGVLPLAASVTITLQVGARATNTIPLVFTTAATTAALGISGININTQAGATAAIGSGANTIDAALSTVNTQRSTLGAIQNRLEFTITTLQIQEENAVAAESAIRDADIARETILFTRNQILVSAGTSILAQANIVPQTALQLLGG